MVQHTGRRAGSPIPSDPPRTAAPLLTLFCGLPGSGKSTLARRLEAAGAGLRVCTDEWQAALGVPHADADFHEILQRRLYEHALQLLEHRVDVVLEDGLWMRQERAEKVADARALGARVVLHLVQVPLETLWGRLQARNEAGDAADYPITRPELDRAAALFEPPTEEELAAFDEVHRHGDGASGRVG